MRQTSLIAVSLSVLLGVAVFAGAGLVTGTQQATEISECTTITESGTYELTNDLQYKGDDPCIDVAANDVSIDGNGHTIQYNLSGAGTSTFGPGIGVTDQQNVVIRDVTFGEMTRLDVHDSTGITAENNRMTGGLDVRRSSNVSIQGNEITIAGADILDTQGVRFTNNQIGDVLINVEDQAVDVTLRDNRGTGRLKVDLAAGQATVVNNTIHDSERTDAITVRAEDGTTVEVARNQLVDNEGGLLVSTDGTARVHNNTLEGTTLHLGGSSDDFVAAHNTITDADVGVVIAGGYDIGPGLTLEHNAITNNTIGVRTNSNLPEIHQNDLSGNSEYGIVYTQDNGVVNATHNYWGDRPSSPEDEHAPFEDPETGALANGTGSAVSEGAAPAGAEPGVSNVHFDPWLDTAPDAGVVEESQDDDDSDGEDSDDTTTTTTTPEDDESTTDDEDTTTTTTTEDDDTTEDDGTTEDGTDTDESDDTDDDTATDDEESGDDDTTDTTDKGC